MEAPELTDSWTVGRWVLVRQLGAPQVGVWPAALFPPAELARWRNALQAP